ncbi:MAG: hypothetical protein ABI700_31005, partial [Chloroflexota bacterium]
MNDFLKKLNVLVKASLNDKLSGAGDTAKPAQVGKMLDEDVKTLRQRINEAVDYEDEIQGRIRQFEAEAAGWDRQADEAVTQGNDANARYAIEQMKRAEQRVALTQSDLQEHQRATQELIQRVNMLAAAVADRTRASAEAAAAERPEATATAPAAQKTPAAEKTAVEQAQTKIEQPEDVQTNIRIPDLGNVLRDARDKISA